MPGIPRGSNGPEETEQPTTELPAAQQAPPPPAPEGATATPAPEAAHGAQEHAGAVSHDATAEDAPTSDAPAAEDAPASDAPAADGRPGFRRRAQMRRRLRYLRRLREIAFRDLGGLVFDLHRFGRHREDLVKAKLEALAGIDAELRTLETTLGDRRDYTDLREAGIAACEACGTLHDSDASFCPGCGRSLRGGEAPAAPAAEAPAEQPAATTTS